MVGAERPDIVQTCEVFRALEKDTEKTTLHICIEFTIPWIPSGSCRGPGDTWHRALEFVCIFT